MRNLARWLFGKGRNAESSLLVLVTTMVILLFLIACGMSDQAMQTIRIEHTVYSETQATLRLDKLLTDVIDAETGQRGYLITGNAAYLAPYTQSKNRIRTDLQQVEEAGFPSASAASTFNQLQAHIDEKMSELNNTIQLRWESGFTAAQQVVNTNYGLEQMNDIRSLLGSLKSTYTNAIDAHEALAKTAFHNTIIWIVSGFVLFSLFLLFAYSQIVRDLRQRRLLLDRLQHEASHDALTAIFNRGFFMELLEYHVTLATRERTTLALLFIDLDGFKKLNDTQGHAKGDEALQYVATQLTQTKRETDILARLGGDEFVLLIREPGTVEDIQVFVDRIFDSLKVDNGEVNPYGLGASIGVARFPEHAGTADEMVTLADTAMYHAKQSGGRRVVFYSSPIE